MTSRWLTDPRGRALAALATVLSLGACPIINPDFDTSAGQTGDAGSESSTSAATSTATSAGATTEPASGSGVTGTAETSATSAPATSTTSTTDPGTTTEPSTTGNPCNPPGVHIDIPVADDAFYISGGTDGQTTCNYYEQLAHPEFPCHALNFGATGALQIARLDGGIDAMYAARFAHGPLQELVDQGAVFFHAELMITVYGQTTKDLELRVGMINEEWLPGDKSGDVGTEGDSSFDSRSIGIQSIPWTNADGPRGASSEVAALPVPLGYATHDVLTSKPFSITKWIEDPLSNHGIVVSFPKGLPPTLLGPGIKAKESPFPPVLRVYHCIP